MTPPHSTDEFPRHFFSRADESPDELFYREPRLVNHIDDATIAALTDYYRETLSQDSTILDLMSSWVSHLPDDIEYARVAGLGMNELELSRNPQLTDFVVHNLNDDPVLPYDAHVFDFVHIVVSIQYLIQPVAVFEEICRTLRTGGQLCVAMSHRLFPTKAVAAFQRLHPSDRVRLVSAYMNRSGFTDIHFIDRSPPDADPLWLVVGRVPGTAA